MTTESLIQYAAQIAKGWRDEEYDAAMVGDVTHALKCHHGAIVLEQFIHDVQAFQVAESRLEAAS